MSETLVFNPDTSVFNPETSVCKSETIVLSPSIVSVEGTTHLIVPSSVFIGCAPISASSKPYSLKVLFSRISDLPSADTSTPPMLGKFSNVVSPSPIFKMF